MRHGSQLLLGLVWAVGMAWLDLRFPVLAGADCCLADPLAVRIGDFQPDDSGPAHQALEAVPDPGRVFAAAGAQGIPMRT